MTLKFMKNYPIQKYAVEQHLYHDIADMVEMYARERYEFPEATPKEATEIECNTPQYPYTKEIFKDEKVVKRFLKELEDNFAYNGSDSFAYTCRCASENGVFRYQEQDEEKEKKRLRMIFGTLLERWAQRYADFYVNEYDIVHEAMINQQEKEELKLLETLAKKHGKKFK